MLTAICVCCWGSVLWLVCMRCRTSMYVGVERGFTHIDIAAGIYDLLSVMLCESATVLRLE